MITIIFNTILTNIILISYGVIFVKYFCKKNYLKITFMKYLFWIIFLSFIVLLLNFFSQLIK